MDTGIDPVQILKLDVQKKLGIAAGILVAILGLYGYLFFLDVQTQIETLDTEIAKQTDDIAKMEASLRKRAQLEKELLELSVKEAEASKVLPQEKQIPELLSTVSNKATVQGLKTTLFQPRPEAPSGIYATIPIDLDVQGSYHQLGTFLNELSGLFRIVKVTELKVKPVNIKSAVGETKDLEVNAKAATYRFVNKPPELPASVKKDQKAGHGDKKTTGQQGAAK